MSKKEYTAAPSDNLQTEKQSHHSGKQHTAILSEKQNTEKRYTVALAGNPNVGKSTVFNALTGLNQHTGNWSGKTVECAYGKFTHGEKSFTVVDLPGCYTATADVGEEKAAARFLAFGSADVTVTVCDASCLERNLILALQVAAMSKRSVICVNLLDEAEKKGLKIDLEQLSKMTGVPVVGTSARRGRGLKNLKDAILKACEKPTPITKNNTSPFGFNSHSASEADAKLSAAISTLAPSVEKYANALGMRTEYLSVELLKGTPFVLSAVREGGCDINADKELISLIESKRKQLDLTEKEIRESVFLNTVRNAEKIGKACTVTEKKTTYNTAFRKLDRILTGKYTAYPLMALLFALILWLTVVGANYPSALLSKYLFLLQDVMYSGMLSIGAPEWLCGALILGVYRVLAWVVSVMLPPMAIFFPLFTLLEDLGYLPRIAFNLDGAFKKCNACGKQALTMCMGLGCNAVGVTGCRIIDSKRERLIAVLTNVFTPCNGRFPTLIAVITMFFAIGSGVTDGVLSTLLLTLVIILGVFITFLVSFILSKTLLKGTPSSFILELPPYRTPDVPSVIFRSVIDRTLFVLGRAVMISAPAGLLIWIMANVSLGGASILVAVSEFLSPFASLLGLDGVILLAFILGFPANEIVLPLAVTIYTQSSSVTELSGAALKTLLQSSGWTVETAISVILFCLCHFPCSTTLMTVYKETKSKKVTVLAALIPTAVGIVLCMLNHLVFTVVF